VHLFAIGDRCLRDHFSRFSASYQWDQQKTGACGDQKRPSRSTLYLPLGELNAHFSKYFSRLVHLHVTRPMLFQSHNIYFYYKIIGFNKILTLAAFWL